MVEQRTENPWVGGSSPPSDILTISSVLVFINLLKDILLYKNTVKKTTKIILQGFEHKELKHVFQQLSVLDTNLKIIRLPKDIKRFTVLRSPHVNKTAREQFEMVTYKWSLYSSIPKVIMEKYIETQKILRKNPSVSIIVK